MKTFAEFAPLLNFNQQVLTEIVREGELRVNAQMTTATAADQRALSIAGFQVASLTALIGGVSMLLLSSTPNVFVIAVGFFQIAAFLVSAFNAIASARPQLFSFPGNSPENWFACDWNFENLTEATATIEQATIEQIYCLNQAISKNTSTMESSAGAMKLAIDLMFWSILMSAVLMAGYAVYILLG